MNNHFVKFVFLVTVIGAVMFSRFTYPAAAPANISEVASGGTVPINQKVPLFVMSSVSASEGVDQAEETKVVAPTGVSNAPPTLSDAASLVADLKTGKIFEDSAPNKRWPTASVAKLMTAVIVAARMDPTSKISITQEMFSIDPTEQTLVVGGTYSVADLLRAMLLPSSNVAAEALAVFYGRGRFIDEMNARAIAWGMTNTYFSDPSGISAASQSTANDLLKLAQNIFANYPQIFQTTRTMQAYITEDNSGKKFLIKSINSFAGDADFVGGKTGHTDEADGNLLSIFKYGGRQIVIVVLGSVSRFDDTQTLYDWYKKL